MGAVLLVILALCLYTVVSRIASLLRNIAKAKRSGFRYIVVPYIAVVPIGHHIYRVCSIIVRSLSLPERWLIYVEAMDINLPFRTRRLWKDRLDDAFFIVSPNLMVLHLCTAELNHWVTSQREKFPKWTPMYEILRVFGSNLVTAEGNEWRQHRRLTAGYFTEANTALVFQESVRQSLSMLRLWTADDEARPGEKRHQRGIILASPYDDVGKLTLHIVNYIGFGIQMRWPGETLAEDTDAALAKFSSPTAPNGYQVPFLEAIAGVLYRIVYVLVFPTWVLEWMPFKDARQAGRDARNFLQYSNELLENRLSEAEQSGVKSESSSKDFLSHLVRTGRDGSGLDRRAMLGNSFILQLAGHETTANALFNTMVYLACFPEAQRRVQQDVDAVVGDTEPSDWEYGKVVNALLASYVGAATYETLRLAPAALSLPKMAANDEVVTKDGVQYTIPGGVPVFLEVMSTAVDARYWPTEPSRYGTGETDLEDYLPERWFRESKKEGQEERQDMSESNRADSKEEEGGKEEEEEEEWDQKLRGAAGVAAGVATGEKLFRPVAGAYAPFSEGARSCTGRRMAQAELMAVMAVVFRGHSIELVVDEEDEQGEEDSTEGQSCDGSGARRALYIEARRKALETLKTSRTTTSLKLADGQWIGLRIVKRGEEKFVGWMEG
ncbi:hypothetical protein V2A60_001384 [Cordyceps javanica]|uniref:Cytochrome P450 n=1 Tax=Cordyceps javanica TaxID=43265 RepID=A0A545VEZ8_9HYPO|nr:cytochrome P450 [Cordyceps javanica]TQW11478.1 cytochrome P450 [Cordyceps javanica]